MQDLYKTYVKYKKYRCMIGDRNKLYHDDTSDGLIKIT